MKVQKYKTTGNRGFFDEQENYEKLSPDFDTGTPSCDYGAISTFWLADFFSVILFPERLMVI